MRFVPDGSTIGDDVGTLTYHAWDQTDGTDLSGAHEGRTSPVPAGSAPAARRPFRSDALGVSDVDVANIVIDGTDLIISGGDEVNKLVVGTDGMGNLVIDDLLNNGYTTNVGSGSGDPVTVDLATSRTSSSTPGARRTR